MLCKCLHCINVFQASKIKINQDLIYCIWFVVVQSSYSLHNSWRLAELSPGQAQTSVETYILSTQRLWPFQHLEMFAADAHKYLLDPVLKSISCTFSVSECWNVDESLSVHVWTVFVAVCSVLCTVAMPPPIWYWYSIIENNFVLSLHCLWWPMV